MNNQYEYCVVIRTLGTAGNKYQSLLNSIDQQTIQPQKILVYIAEGYALPKETIGKEEYIRCSKGMVMQRSLPFDEVNTEYMLLCDDDISFPPDFVEKLFEGMDKHQGDCISPCVSGPNPGKQTWKQTLKRALISNEIPRRDDGWAVKIMRNGSYSYNLNPSQEIMPTQSAMFTCALIKKTTYQAIHFEDERWLDKFKYAQGDDLLFFYKLYMMNYNVLFIYNTGMIHLDAGTSSKKLPKDWYRKNQMIWFVIPYRIKYDLKNNTSFEKIRCINSYLIKMLLKFLVTPIRAIKERNPVILLDFFRGIKDGYKYVHSTEYLEIPKYDNYM